MKKLFFAFCLIFFSVLGFSQEKGAILIGVTSSTNQTILYDNILNYLKTKYGNALKKTEYCSNHSLIYLVVDIQIKPIPTQEEIIDDLTNNFTDHQFYAKWLHENVESLNCKWK